MAYNETRGLFSKRTFVYWRNRPGVGSLGDLWAVERRVDDDLLFLALGRMKAWMPAIGPAAIIARQFEIQGGYLT